MDHLLVDRLVGASLSLVTPLPGGQDPEGQPIPGFTLDECPEIIGDQIERTVAWKGGSDLSSLSGKTVRMRVVLKDADLYSIRFH